MHTDKEKAYIAVILSNTVWSYSAVSGKFLLQSLTPLQIILVRFAIGVVVLSLFSFKEKIPFHVKEEFYYALTGFFGIFLYVWLNHVALIYTTATNVGVLSAITPIITGLFGYIFLKEKQLDRFFWIGSVIAMIGVMLIYLSGMEFKVNIIGDTIVLVNGIIWSVYAVLLGKINQFGYSVMAINRKVNMYGFLFIAIAYIVTNDSREWSGLFDKGIIPNLLILGIGASALCFAGWSYSVKILGAGRTSIFSYFGVILIVFLSSIFLGDRLDGKMMVAICLILLGTIFSEQGKNIVSYINKNNVELYKGGKQNEQEN